MNKEHIFPQILLRSWPFPRGAGRLTYKLFRRIRFRSEIATVKTTDGFTISIMPNDLIGRHIYLTGEFDRSTVEILCAFAEPGDMLLDIGANIGYVSACFLHNVPSSSAVVVDPQPGVLDLLNQNLAHFGQRSRVYPFAISDRDGEALFKIDNENRGASAISNDGIRIETRSAASLFGDNEIKSLDIVKIDVEGHEEPIIRSCLDRFRAMQPKIIMFEERGARSAGSIGAMLRSIDYDIFGVMKTLTRLNLKPIASANDWDCNDYVAVSRQRALPHQIKARFRWL